MVLTSSLNNCATRRYFRYDDYFAFRLVYFFPRSHSVASSEMSSRVFPLARATLLRCFFFFSFFWRCASHGGEGTLVQQQKNFRWSSVDSVLYEDSGSRARDDQFHSGSLGRSPRSVARFESFGVAHLARMSKRVSLISRKHVPFPGE